MYSPSVSHPHSAGNSPGAFSWTWNHFFKIKVFCYSKFWKHLFIYSQGGPILFQYSYIQLFLESVYCPSTSANLRDEIYQVKPFNSGALRLKFSWDNFDSSFLGHISIRRHGLRVTCESSQQAGLAFCSPGDSLSCTNSTVIKAMATTSSQSSSLILVLTPW